LFVRAPSPYDAGMGRKPYESDFKVDVYEDRIAVHFWPTQSLYTFTRFTTERDIAEFGPLSPGPVIKHASRSSGGWFHVRAL
jgi:hypothetical protein